MASLIDNLITTLEQENEEYQTLLGLSMEKTGIIVKGDHAALSAIVEKEQEVVTRLVALEKKRAEATGDIAIVLKTLTLTRLTELLSGQKKEADALRNVHDKLSGTMAQMVRINEHNKVLLQESLDMLEFEINLVQSMKQGPATANYAGRDYANNDYGMNGSFDTKQ